MRKNLAVLELFSAGNSLTVFGVSSLSLMGMCLIFAFFAEGTLLEIAIDSVKIPLIAILLAGFAVICIQLGFFGGMGDSCTEYTIRRLRISEREFLLLQALHNCMLLFLYWGMMGLAMWVMCVNYAAKWPGIMNTPELFAACRRSPLLGSLLPAGNLRIWIRNVFYVLSLGYLGAVNALVLRKTRTVVFPPYMIAAVWVVMGFTLDTGKAYYLSDLALTLSYSVLLFGVLVWGMIKARRLLRIVEELPYEDE